jgi:hypothetical protein
MRSVEWQQPFAETVPGTTWEPLLYGITDPATLESLVCREALALDEDLGINRIYVASDCKRMVSDIKSGSKGRYGCRIEEIKLRSTQFQECSFVFESGVVNFKAHNLARFTTSLGIGRHLCLGIPYDINIPVNILVDE